MIQKAFVHLADYTGKHRWLIAFLFLLGVFRVYLATSGGHLYWPDEWRYLESVELLQDLVKGDFRLAADHFFQADARPGLVFLNLFPAATQRFFYAAGIIEPASLHYFDIPAVLNVLVSLAISLLFYHILRLLGPGRRLSLLGTVVYSLLVNSNLYIRHLFPCDYSLLLLLAAFFLVLRGAFISGIKVRTVLISGLLAGAAFSVYLGYYLFVAIIAVVIASAAAKKMQRVGLYLLFAAGVTFFWEIIARLIGRLYIWRWDLFHHTARVRQGTYREGYSFAVRYLGEVEGVIGYALIVLFALWCVFFLFRPSTGKIVKAIFLAAAGAYLYSGTLSVVFHHTVFMGRSFHMYLPFLVWGSILAVSRIRSRRIQILISLLVAGMSLFSFSNFAYHYSRLSYPHDFTYRSLQGIPKKEIARVQENRSYREEDLARWPVIAVNLRRCYPLPGKFFPFTPPGGMELVKSVPHPLSFPAYFFEGYTVSQRKELKNRNYQMSIYRRKDCE